MSYLVYSSNKPEVRIITGVSGNTDRVFEFGPIIEPVKSRPMALGTLYEFDLLDKETYRVIYYVENDTPIKKVVTDYIKDGKEYSITEAISIVKGKQRKSRILRGHLKRLKAASKNAPGV